MGLLDDAIREHLELKRQHGADPQEVTRQEQEALGAARRAEFAKPEGQAPEEAEEAAAEAPEEPQGEAPAAAGGSRRAPPGGRAGGLGRTPPGRRSGTRGGGGRTPPPSRSRRTSASRST